jgi:thiol-disulfide isomerase/thioredoxin
MKAVYFLALAGLFGLIPPSFAGTPGEVEVGGMLREAQLNGLTAPPRKLSEYRGKPLVINVWASWCGPCRQEMASLDRLSRRHGGKRFNLIGISTDDDMEAAYRFLEQAGISFDNFIDRKLEMESMLGAYKLPLTLLVDAQGRVLSKHYGAMEWDSPQAKQMIAKAFGIKL